MYNAAQQIDYKKVFTTVNTRINKLLRGNPAWLDRYADGEPQESPFLINSRRIRPEISAKLEGCRQLLSGMRSVPSVRPVDCPAAYHRVLDKIYMPGYEQLVSLEMYYSTLFHEIIHSTGFRNRLNRPELNGWMEPNDDFYCREEMIAESGAAYLAELAGIGQATAPYNAAYIHYYRQIIGTKTSALRQARTKAQTAVLYLLPATQTLALTRPSIMD